MRTSGQPARNVHALPLILLTGKLRLVAPVYVASRDPQILRAVWLEPLQRKAGEGERAGGFIEDRDATVFENCHGRIH